MIVMRYTGGLGNQMFQYAMSLVLKQRFPNEQVLADTSFYYFKQEHEGFVLDTYFALNVPKINAAVEKRVLGFQRFFNLLPLGGVKRFVPSGMLRKIDNTLEKRRRCGVIVDYASTLYNPDVFNLNNEDVDLWHYKGNWINPLYWKGYEKKIISAFCFREELLTEEDKLLIKELQETESVAIHIRSGDYIGNAQFELCKEDYYQNAVNKFLQLNGNGNVKFFLFSESENVNTSFITGVPFKIITSRGGDGNSLWLMSKCKHNIIANSTFSYWAALLNHNENKIVIAPKYAYRKQETFISFPLPEDWIQLDNCSINIG